MRLRTETKKSLTKTNKQIKANKEKKYKGPKLSKNYTSTEVVKADRIDLDFTQLSFGALEGHDVKYILLDNFGNIDRIEIDNSWIGLLLLLLSYIYENNSNEFLDILVNNEITNQNLLVDTKYGKYTFDKNTQYKVYKLYNTKYYVEAIFNSEVIFMAIYNCVKYLNIPLDKIKFGLVIKSDLVGKLNFSNFEDKESIVNFSDTASMINKGIHMLGICILGNWIKVHRLDVALFMICSTILNTFGKDTLLEIKNTDDTGICSEIIDNKHLYQKINNSELYIFTNGDDKSILEFIGNIMEYIGLDDTDIQFKFRAIRDKSSLKEWEVE